MSNWKLRQMNDEHFSLFYHIRSLNWVKKMVNYHANDNINMCNNNNCEKECFLFLLLLLIFVWRKYSNNEIDYSFRHRFWFDFELEIPEWIQMTSIIIIPVLVATFFVQYSYEMNLKIPRNNFRKRCAKKREIPFLKWAWTS